MSDKQVNRICSTIRYLGLCMVRSAVILAMKPGNSNLLMDQTLREYGNWLAETSSNDAYDNGAGVTE